MDTIAVMTRALIAALALVACACQDPPSCEGVPNGDLASCGVGMLAFCREESSGTCMATDAVCVGGAVTCRGGEGPACYSNTLDICGSEPDTRPDGPTCEAPGGGPLAAPECVGGGLPYCVTSSGCTNNAPPLCDMDGPTCGAGETVQCLEAAPPSC